MEKDLQLAQRGDQPGALQLVGRVTAVAGALVRSRRREQAQLVCRGVAPGATRGTGRRIADVHQLQRTISSWVCMVARPVCGLPPGQGRGLSIRCVAVVTTPVRSCISTSALRMRTWRWSARSRCWAVRLRSSPCSSAPSSAGADTARGRSPASAPQVWPRSSGGWTATGCRRWTGRPTGPPTRSARCAAPSGPRAGAAWRRSRTRCAAASGRRAPNRRPRCARRIGR